MTQPSLFEEPKPEPKPTQKQKEPEKPAPLFENWYDEKGRLIIW